MLVGFSTRANIFIARPSFSYSITMFMSALEEAGDTCTGKTVLDAGCGTGLVGENLMEIGFGALTGIDNSPGMLAKSKERNVYAAHLNEPLPYPHASFDACTCIGVLTYVDSSKEPNLVAEAARVVRPGGYVLFSSRSDKCVTWETHADALVDAGQWEHVDTMGPMPYLPGHPEYAEDLLVKIYCFKVLK